jgi:glycerol uptake facilitator-like aquaporin
MLSHILIELLSTAIFIFVVFLTKSYLWVGLITGILIFVSSGRSMFNPAIAIVNYFIGALSITETGILILAEIIGGILGFQLTRLV